MTRKKVAATLKNYENENDIVLEWMWADFKYTAKHAAEKKNIGYKNYSCFLSKEAEGQGW